MNNLEFHTPYIDRGQAETLLSRSSEFDFRKALRGGTSSCILLDEYAILYSKIFTENRNEVKEYQKTMELVYCLFSQGKKVAPILGYIRSLDKKGIENTSRRKADKGKDFIILKKAPGKTIDDMKGYDQVVDKVTERLSSSKKHYDEIVDTLLCVLDSELKPDISPKNTIFDSKEGFSLVDFNSLEKKPKKDIYIDPIAYNEEHIGKFLRSFITQKKFPNNQMRQMYLKLAIREQQILCEALLNKGVTELIVESAVSKIEELKSPTLTKLYSK